MKRQKKLCEYFNKFVNTLKKEREQKFPEDKYPWLDPDDEWRHMTDREILDKYINLDSSCLHEEKKREVIDMLFKYKEAWHIVVHNMGAHLAFEPGTSQLCTTVHQIQRSI